MTTAGRPTFDPSRGGQGRGEKDLSSISKQYSSRDLPSHTKLKYRDLGQGTVEEQRNRDFRKELEEREAEAKGNVKPRRLAIEAAAGEAAAKKPKAPDQVSLADLDADDPVYNSDSGSESDDDDDDTETLMAELQRIRKERAADQAKKEMQRQMEDERIRTENILNGNPLLNYSAEAGEKNMKVRRGWDDDVIFKNCARSEPKKKYEFINDSLRSEFHRKFMEKYVK